MGSCDWSDTEAVHRLTAQQVAPGDLDKRVGEDLELCSDGATVTYGYYTDARVSASVTLADPAQLVENAWVRLVHTVEGTGFSEELGTFLVADVTPTFKSGGRKWDLDLRSPMWAMSQDISAGGYTIGQGAKLSQALEQEFGWGRVAYTTAGMVDYRWRSVLALETCKDRLSWLFSTLDPTGNRADVDGHGRVWVTRYVRPHDRASSMLVDCDDPSSVVVSGSVEWSGNRMDRTNKVVVKAIHDQAVFVANAYPSASASWSRERRGWTKSELHELNDFGQPWTQAHAAQLAKTYLSQDSATDSSWDLSTAAWLPIRAGDVVDFAPRAADPWGSGDARKCLVKDVEADLSSWTQKITLKEV